MDGIEYLRVSLTGQETVLEEAARVTSAERNVSYGHPMDNHTATAAMVSAYLNRRYGTDLVLDFRDVAWFNVLQKISRDAHHLSSTGRSKRDDLVDVCGYVRNIEQADEVLGFN